MYRQVRIDYRDRKFQRIVWRENTDSPIQHFQLNTVTYGISSSPFLAIRTLIQLANDEGHKFPMAATALKRDFYVDDFLSGSDTLRGASNLCHELMSLLQSGGFILRKWTSNNPEILVTIPEQYREISPIQIKLDTSTVKVLGIQWQPSTDCFSFNVNLDSESPPTKRRILSEASKIYDPFGWLTPSTVLAKMLFQRLWLLKLDWDTIIPSDIARTWMDLRTQLVLFENLRIPRWLGTNSSDKFQLHGFCDASEHAYAAAVYCRHTSSNGDIVVNLIAAKSRVAPLRQISLPRLELCGATLLVRLLNFTKQSLEMPNIETIAWTDSTVVLSWLEDTPRRWKTFVANRAAEIIESLPRQHWNHISSKYNPADCASRGISPEVLVNYKLWWRGPPWLQCEDSLWPISSTVPEGRSHLPPEEEKINKIITHNVQQSPDILDELCTAHSSMLHINRIIACILRFINNSRFKNRRIAENYLSADEHRMALHTCIRLVQGKQFSNEIEDIKRGRPVHKKSRLSSLLPFLDNEGILRVGGRLQESLLSYNAKHPIVLSKEHPFVSLVVRHFHYKHLHAGVTLLSSLLKQHYWILGQRNLVKQIVHKCIICFHHRRQLKQNQLMGNLPQCRVRPSPPFLKTGCDYAGPISLKLHKGRGARTSKGYIVIFVCMAVKAIHLEAVTDMTTDAFLAALRRFISRRGKCTDLYSDNGTTLVGASRSLAGLKHSAIVAHHENIEVAKSLAEDGVRWHFIPPYAPNFGGLWESNIKSVKQHLKRVIGDASLTYEELCTLLCQIECLLNSRPLSVLSNVDIEALTPSHFLIGRSMTSIPEPDIVHITSGRLQRWQLLQQMLQGFWSRWQGEYLTSLQPRTKWRDGISDIKEDALVLVKEANLPPTKWMLGRVIKCHPGKDGIIRVVTLKTKNGEIKRATSKLCPLPVD